MEAEKMVYLGEDEIVKEIAMKAAETADRFIFETVLPFCQENYQGELKKEDLCRALGKLRQKPVQITKAEYQAFCSVCEMFDYRASVLHDEEDFSGVERMCRAIDDYWDDLHPAGVALDGESESAQVDFQTAKKKCDGLRAVRKVLHALIGSGALEINE